MRRARPFWWWMTSGRSPIWWRSTCAAKTIRFANFTAPWRRWNGEQEELSLAILDVMLPEMDGFTLCQRIRGKASVPIIMLTAKVEDMDKITGLTLGADDYITKPFNPLELMARVKTQLRRYKRYNVADSAAQEAPDEYDIRGLHISRSSHKCRLNGEELPADASGIQHSLVSL